MNSPLTGIHHVTAIASDPQANIDFYSGLLGLRLVKKTVNFDDPSAYHIYYGDETGAPGTIVTFFYWPGKASRGRIGSGQMTRISFSAAPAALDFWQDRLQRHGIAIQRQNRFAEDVIAFADPDGIPIEIVGVDHDPRSGWKGGEVPPDFVLRGLHYAELTVRNTDPTERLLTHEMGFRLVRRDGNRSRFEAGAGGSGAFIDLIELPLPFGMSGVGTVHHIAWRLADDAGQLDMHARLSTAGYAVSPVRDRTYFHSIYYREYGSILFEIATDSPGFAIDEEVASLGTALKLPQQFEPNRSKIEGSLPALHPARQFA